MTIRWLSAYAFRTQMPQDDRERFDQLRERAAAEGLTTEEEQEAETIIRRSQQKVHNPQSLRREQTVEEMMAEIDNLPSE